MAGTSAPAAFVWAGVLTQVISYWGVMRVKAQQIMELEENKNHYLSWLIIFPVGLAALQLWGFDPWFSQRLFSIYIALNVILGAVGLLSGDLKVAGRQPTKTEPIHHRFDLHVVQVQILVMVLAIAVNERMMIADTALNARIAVLAVMPLAAHYLVWIIIFITHPPIED